MIEVKSSARALANQALENVINVNKGLFIICSPNGAGKTIYQTPGCVLPSGWERSPLWPAGLRESAVKSSRFIADDLYFSQYSIEETARFYATLLTWSWERFRILNRYFLSTKRKVVRLSKACRSRWHSGGICIMPSDT